MGQDGHRTDDPAARHQRDADPRPNAVLEGPGHGALPLWIVIDDQRLLPLKGQPRHPLPDLEGPRGIRLVAAVVSQAVQQAGAGDKPVEGGAVDAQQVAGQIDRELRQRGRLEDPAGRHGQFVQGSECPRADRRTGARLLVDH